MKQMAESIVNNGINPFENRFYETSLPLMRLAHIVPSCFLQYTPTKNELPKSNDGKPDKIGGIDIVSYNDKRIVRNLERYAKQDYVYVMNFITKDLVSDVLSDSNKPGIIDQCIEYVCKNRKIKYTVPPKPGSVTESINPDGIEYTAYVDAGNSGLNLDYIEEGIFVVYLDIKIADGVYGIEEIDTLTGAKFEIIPPVKVEKTEE
jgi:hypothetical protein